ncbi:MAG TPA: C4-dicarboxylate ABC transporter permease [Synergistaceae bacterium]|nr:C4-dicarboxylate ABC transporter permease [Synergistaceae bacterium]
MSKLYDLYGKVQGAVISFLMLFVGVLMFIQVILRYVLKMPLMGIEELLLFPTIWLYMLGGAHASFTRTHITCGVLTLLIKRKKSFALFNIAQTVISIVVALWLTRWAWWFFTYSLRTMKESPLLYIPLILAESAIFVGLALMVLNTVVEFFSHVSEYRSFDGTELIKEVK